MKKKYKYKTFFKPITNTMYGVSADPMGSYTGYPVMVDEPEQDADDL